MIKFEHSVFALPFALTGALLAWREGGWAGARIPGKLFWIVVAMVGARTVPAFLPQTPYQPQSKKGCNLCIHNRATW